MYAQRLSVPAIEIPRTQELGKDAPRTPAALPEPRPVTRAEPNDEEAILRWIDEGNPNCQDV
jgi:hypothetical protein